jgi:hypothetical protein
MCKSFVHFSSAKQLLIYFFVAGERNIFCYGGTNLFENASKKAVLMKQTIEAT